MCAGCCREGTRRHGLDAAVCRTLPGSKFYSAFLIGFGRAHLRCEPDDWRDSSEPSVSTERTFPVRAGSISELVAVGMLALKREERYIVHQVSSDMNFTEARPRKSAVTHLPCSTQLDSITGRSSGAAAIQHDVHFITEEEPYGKAGPFNSD